MAQRFEGRNLEDALKNATQTLGVDRWQLTYHVLLEKRGFLGGVKRIVIEADVNAEAPPPPPPLQPLPYYEDTRPRRTFVDDDEDDEAPAPAEAEAAPRVLSPDRRPRTAGTDRPPRRDARGGRGGGGGGRDRAPAGGGRDRGGRGGRRNEPAPAERSGGRGRGRRGPDRGDELQPGDFEQFIVAPAPEQGPESEAALTVRAWVEKVIALAKLELEVRTEENDTQLIVRLYGKDGHRLVAEHGELLDAIQVLANKTLVGRKVEKEIELDCQQFKDKRTEELRQRALEAAARVRESGREEVLPAMTPIERRIVHLTLQEDADVTTDSRGDGFYKRVAIVRRPAKEE
ncbi:MAG TPA: R3H domain-containing nucleic acid-binding protein [Thermoanaerobaculia bacterium]